MKYALVILCLILPSYSVAQIDTGLFRKDCLILKNDPTSPKNVLDVSADKLLNKGQILIYFHLLSSDTIRIYIDDSIISKEYITVLPDRTGDKPDFYFKFGIPKKSQTLAVYFEKYKTYFRIPLSRKYKIYGIVYHTGIWGNCIFVEKKKYFHFN